MSGDRGVRGADRIYPADALDDPNRRYCASSWLSLPCGCGDRSCGMESAGARWPTPAMIALAEAGPPCPVHGFPMHPAPGAGRARTAGDDVSWVCHGFDGEGCAQTIDGAPLPFIPAPVF